MRGFGDSAVDSPFEQGAALMARLEAFSRFSESDKSLTRVFLSAEHKAAASQLMEWMREAGMSARMDAAGNVIGRYEAKSSPAPAVLLGSHIDTVRDAGKYDGTLGVLAAVAAVNLLHRRGQRLGVAIEVIAFGDEEGVRFPVTLTGSRACAGYFDPATLQARDDAGITLMEALRAFGGNPEALHAAAYARDKAIAYIELHIEQGPQLENAGLPLGVVTAINGASRFAVDVEGMAGHAGTVPMTLRRDALAAAAEMIVFSEATAREASDIFLTVGQIKADPGAVNVIPGGAHFTIDLRCARDAGRLEAEDILHRGIRAIANRRDMSVTIARTHHAPATPCTAWISDYLEESVMRVAGRGLRLTSGGGHDAMAMAMAMPIGMIFVRCRAGISHHGDESITVEDADLAVRVLVDVLLNGSWEGRANV